MLPCIILILISKISTNQYTCLLEYITVRLQAQETRRFRKPKALGCGVPSIARTATTGPEAF